MQSSKHWWIRMLKELTEYGNNIKEEMKIIYRGSTVK